MMGAKPKGHNIERSCVGVIPAEVMRSRNYGEEKKFG